MTEWMGGSVEKIKKLKLLLLWNERGCLFLGSSKGV